MRKGNFFLINNVEYYEHVILKIQKNKEMLRNRTEGFNFVLNYITRESEKENARYFRVTRVQFRKKNNKTKLNKIE